MAIDECTEQRSSYLYCANANGAPMPHAPLVLAHGTRKEKSAKHNLKIKVCNEFGPRCLKGHGAYIFISLYLHFSSDISVSLSSPSPSPSPSPSLYHLQSTYEYLHLLANSKRDEYRLLTWKSA
jgi:hypothetical protein